MTPLTRLVCGSANPDKVVEMAALLEGTVELVPRPLGMADVVEDADTLQGNARLKARAVCVAAALPAVGDDTGLFVNALAGAPGVWSARYAGEHATYADNRAKLLGELSRHADRRAEFRTVVVVAWPDGDELVVQGVCAGTVSTAERGTGMFGYDPVFVPDGGDGRTFGEMTPSEKHALSHRGRAFAALTAALRSGNRT